MQGSVDGGEDMALADILTADAVGARAASANSKASAENGAIVGRSSSSAKGAGTGKAKTKPATTTTKRNRVAPNIREEIDAW